MGSKAHLITGGFPIGSGAGHDMDFVRVELLRRLYETEVGTTVGNDFNDVAARLDGADLLITYVAGPYPNDEQCRAIDDWLNDGGKWFALHGTSGGRAARVPGNEQRRQMVRLAHHDLLGAFFLNHPPIRKFTVAVDRPEHPIFNGLPKQFDVVDELYLIEPMSDSEHLLSTKLAKDPSPERFGFVYKKDTSLQADGKTRVLGTERTVGKGKVVYIALGHTHVPVNNSQPFVDASVEPSGKTPATFRGTWDTPSFDRLLSNAIQWGVA